MKLQKNAFTALFPCPVVLVSCVDYAGKSNIITLAWAGTVCSEPPMVGVSIRPTRYSYQVIKDTKEFVVNIPPTKFIQETDYCGVASGKDVDKFSETKFTPEKAQKVNVPMIQECPVNLECILKDVIPLGAHDLFLGEVVQVHFDEKVLDETGKLDFSKADPFVFNVGEYWSLNKKIGSYGFSQHRK